MAISTELLEILICPACRAKVELKSDGGGLRCVSCHRLYPIRDEIPVMMIAEARFDKKIGAFHRIPTLSHDSAQAAVSPSYGCVLLAIACFRHRLYRF